MRGALWKYALMPNIIILECIAGAMVARVSVINGKFGDTNPFVSL